MYCKYYKSQNSPLNHHRKNINLTELVYFTVFLNVLVACGKKVTVYKMKYHFLSYTRVYF